jgi:hypothetical protein
MVQKPNPWPRIVEAMARGTSRPVNNIRRLYACCPGEPVKVSVMKTLVEDAEKLEYLTSDSHWTKTAAAGKDFGTTGTALVVAEQEPIANFNIVGYFPANKQFINLVRGRGKDIPKTSVVSIPTT